MTLPSVSYLHRAQYPDCISKYPFPVTFNPVHLYRVVLSLFICILSTLVPQVISIFHPLDSV